MARLRLTPVRLRAARAFVGAHHRHARPPQGGLFAVGVADGGELAGVAIAGRPVARPLDDGRTVEVTRVCTTGQRNACSMLYGAICRAAAALGYERIVTYTRAAEPGSSLRASGFARVAAVEPREWSCPARPCGAAAAPGPKFRWERRLVARDTPPTTPQLTAPPDTQEADCDN